MDRWLIRTSDNVIIGPYPQEKILSLVQAGKLSPQDELCAANQYWFYLYEPDEVSRHLGPEAVEILSALQREEDPDDEETYTDAVPLGQTKLTDISKSPDENVKKPVTPKDHTLDDDDPEPPTVHIPHTWGNRMDRNSVWLVLIITILGAMALVVITLIEILRI